ncbi:MAG TPA: hypothetical protein ENF18_08485 [candidate division WOR-3 bacterium]|uniref:Uncharacterized protein n=1 Tax=candidate division WOR-3 bacterium TaxID=2052148 RepID=A0A7C0VDM5_UNCW3|nr:hypothetical protein [candidate division WOR-3 bacterium]
MIVMAFFKKRRKARVFLKNLEKKGLTQKGFVVKVDMIRFIGKLEEKQGYTAIFETETDMEAVKKLAASLFPENSIEFISWD